MSDDRGGEADTLMVMVHGRVAGITIPQSQCYAQRMSSSPLSPPVAPAAAQPVATVPVWQTLSRDFVTKQTEYFEFLNQGLVAFMPRAIRRMLDLGCGGGLLGHVLKEEGRLQTAIGIEPDERAVALAKQRLNQVIRGTLDNTDLEANGITHGSLDAIVAADVLEHLYNPWAALVRMRPYLSSDGFFYASIPNARNLALIAHLADAGLWRYEERGLLDITHIRFFTLREIHTMFAETGYRVVDVGVNVDPRLQRIYDAEKDKPEASFKVGRLTYERITPDDLTELCTWQFLIKAAPAA